MIRCPKTGRAISTRIRADVATFHAAPVFFSQVLCPLCQLTHEWFAKDAWICECPANRRRGSRTAANRPFVDFVIYRFARALGRIVELESEMRPDDYAPRLIVTDLEAVRSIARVLAEPGKSSGIVSVHVRNAPLVGQTVGLVGLLRQFKSNVDSALGSHVAVDPWSFVDGPRKNDRWRARPLVRVSALCNLRPYRLL